MLKALITRLSPFRVSSPAGSASISASTAVWTFRSISIWPSRASAHRRAARFTTVPIARIVEAALRSRCGRAWHIRARCRCRSRVRVRACATRPRARRPPRASRPPCAPRAARIGAWQRIVEQDHQAVAGEALERAFEFVDQCAERVMIVAQHLHHFFRLRRLGERREPAQVAEHDGDFAAMAFEHTSSPR